jgi:ribonuclease BN (tRNA processing enzyme)
MRLVTVGVAGSFPGPHSPASTYLLQVPAELAEASGLTGSDVRDWNVVLDLGNGGLGGLQRHVDPMGLDAVAISHLHPDHSADLSGLYVYRKYHPTSGVSRTGAPKRLPVLGPTDVAERVGTVYGLEPGETMDDVYEFAVWRPGQPARVGPFEIDAFPVYHPIEAYGLRVTAPSSLRPGERATLTYSGDTDHCDGVVVGARDADLLLAEAAFQEGRDDVVEPGIHLTGRRAGKIATEAGAQRLLLTHLPAWSDPQVALDEAQGVYGGPVELATPGGVYEV